MSHLPPKIQNPRTKAKVQKYIWNSVEHNFVSAEFAEELETQLNEARALLTRISDGAEPVLLAEEIDEFLDKTELP